MRRVRSIAVIMGLCAGSAIGAAWAQSDPFVGLWHLDRAHSALPPGEPAPDDVTIEIIRADSRHLTWSLNVLAAPGGEPNVETFDAPPNGEFRHINEDTMASFLLDGDTLQVTFKGPAGEVDALTCALSADKKTMTCNGAITGSDGKTSRYVDVYDRK